MQKIFAITALVALVSAAPHYPLTGSNTPAPPPYYYLPLADTIISTVRTPNPPLSFSPSNRKPTHLKYNSLIFDAGEILEEVQSIISDEDSKCYQKYSQNPIELKKCLNKSYTRSDGAILFEEDSMDGITF